MGNIVEKPHVCKYKKTANLLRNELNKNVRYLFTESQKTLPRESKEDLKDRAGPGDARPRSLSTVT